LESKLSSDSAKLKVKKRVMKSITLFYCTSECVVLSLIENRVNCMKLLYLRGIRQYAAKHKSISYYIIMILFWIGFM
jgi:hypothetical protein